MIDTIEEEEKTPKYHDYIKAKKIKLGIRKSVQKPDNGSSVTRIERGNAIEDNPTSDVQDERVQKPSNIR